MYLFVNHSFYSQNYLFLMKKQIVSILKVTLLVTFYLKKLTQNPVFQQKAKLNKFILLKYKNKTFDLLTI